MKKLVKIQPLAGGAVQHQIRKWSNAHLQNPAAAQMKRVISLTKIEKFNEAALLLDFIIQENPGDLQAVTYRIKLAGKIGDLQKTRGHFLNAKGHVTVDERLAATYMTALHKCGAPLEDIEEIFQKYFGMNSQIMKTEMIFILKNMADAAEREGRLKLTVNYLNRMTGLKPDNKGHWIWLMRLYGILGDMRRAKQLFELANGAYEIGPRLMKKIVYVYLKALTENAAKFAAIEKIFSRVVKNFPDNEYILAQMMDAASKHGHNQTADELFKKCTQLQNPSGIAYEFRLQNHIASGKIADAFAIYKAAMDEGLTTSKMHVSMISGFAGCNRMTEAEGIYLDNKNRELEKGEVANFHVAMMRAYAQHNRLSEAEALFKQRKSAIGAPLYAGMIEVNAIIGDWNAVEKTFKESRRVYENSGRVYASVIRSSFKAGNAARASELFAEAKETNHATVDVYQAYLIGCINTGNAEQIRAACSEAENSGIEYPSLVMQTIRGHVIAGNITKALDIFEACLRDGHEKPDYYAAFACACDSKNETGIAQKVRQLADKSGMELGTVNSAHFRKGIYIE